MARIAVITPEYPGVRPSFGGIAAQYATIGPALAALGDEVHIFVVAAERGPIWEQDGVVLHRVAVSAGSGPLFSMARCIATRRAIRDLPSFDVIVAADWSGNGSFLDHAGSMHLVTHLHTCLALFLRISDQSMKMANLRARLQVYLEQRQVARSVAILACSHAIISAVSTFWNLESIPSTVLPNVIDPQRIVSMARTRPKKGVIIHGAPVIAAPGRLETRKGVGILIRAMDLVWDVYPDATIVFAGSDGIVEGRPARERITELAGQRSGKVVFAGALATESLFPMLVDADVVVTPSLWEAFGIATLEAMALGKRVVATSGSGYSEFCRNGVNSVLVAPNDVAELSNGLLNALADNSGRLEQAAMATAEEFAVNRRAPEYREYLHRVISLL